MPKRTVEVKMTAVEYVTVVVPKDAPDDIDEWDLDHFDTVYETAREKVLDSRPDWEIDDDHELEIEIK